MLRISWFESKSGSQGFDGELSESDKVSRYFVIINRVKFPKDILIIDFEGRPGPVQLGAVLLDKETLEEKDHFVSYIWQDMKGEVKKTTGISQETLEGAPSMAEVAKAFLEKFGTNVFLSGFVVDFDMSQLKLILKEAGLEFKLYDYHIYDIWPVAYTHLLKNDYTGSIRSEEIFQAFGAKPRELHDALEDCKIAADVLRNIILN